MWNALVLTAVLLQTPTDLLTVQADRQSRTDGVVRANGNVIATYQDMEVRADWIVFEEATERLTAGDHVIFKRAEENVEGDTVDMVLSTKTGTIQNAQGMLAPGFHVVAGKVFRRENGEYEVFNALITSCQPNEPAWQISLARAVIEPGQGVTAQGAVFRFQRVPLFYFPYVTVPSASRSRASGFLIPTTSTSTTKGRSVRESFYYAINRSSDLMLTGEYFTERGPAGAVEFRAVPNAESRIEVSSFFVRDRLKQGGQSARILAQSRFGRGFRAAADMNIVSSFLFRQVFEEGFNVISSPIEHSLAFLSYGGRAASANILFNRTGVFYENQQTTVTRQFPSIDATLNTRRIGSLPVYFSLDGGWVGFSRRDAALDTPLLVNRFTVAPSIEIPVLRSNAFEWTHRLSARDTLYSHSLRPLVSQDALHLLAIDYGFHFVGPRIEKVRPRWQHTFEPTLDYRYIRGARRFDERIVVDDVDLFTDTHEAEYGFTHRFFRGHEFLTWRVAQKYFFDPTFGGSVTNDRRNVILPLLDLTGFAYGDRQRRFSPIVSTLRIATNPNAATLVQVNYDTVKRQFRSAGIIGEVNQGPTFANLAYFFTRRSITQVPSNQVRGTVGYGNNQKLGLSGAFNFAYDVERKTLQGSTTQVSYNADCYGLSLEFLQFNLGARHESRIRFSFSLKNLGSFGTLRRQERLF